TYTALLADLEQRGLLDETLVLMMSDFGRTPRVNGSAGRDHRTPWFNGGFARGGVPGGGGGGGPRPRPGLRQGPPGAAGGRLRDGVPLPGHRPGDDGPRPRGPADRGGAGRRAHPRDIGLRQATSAGVTTGVLEHGHQTAERTRSSPPLAR